MEVLGRRTEPADVVWVGLSLHHLRQDGNAAVLKDIRRLLAPRGFLILYENTSPDGEDRAGWLARWDRQRPAWTAYSDADWDTMTAHVHAADFPETRSDWRRLAEMAGFQEVRELFVAPTELLSVFSFR